MIVFYSHTVSERAGETWLRGAVYTKKTMIKRTILTDRYTQMTRGRGSVGCNIHGRLRGQYLLTTKHVLRRRVEG